MALQTLIDVLTNQLIPNEPLPSASAAPLRVLVEPAPPAPAPALRVPTPPTAPPPPLSHIIPDDAPLIEPLPIATPASERIPTPTPIITAPMPAPPPPSEPSPVTYDQLTGPAGQHCCRKARPPKKTHPAPKGTRQSQRKRKPRTNYAAQPGRPRGLECDPYEVHWAMHGTAINPDTDVIA
jgi:hypothetical protein